MKFVIFITLLSIYICSGKPADSTGPPSNEKIIPTTVNPKVSSTIPSNAISTASSINSVSVTPKQNLQPQVEKKNETSINEHTTESLPSVTNNQTVTTKPHEKLSVSNETQVTNGTTPIVTTHAPKTVPTVEPKHNDMLKSRGFDGPSFIGGIILTLGLIAVGFMGFKYYKTQTERNYHTL